MGTQLVDETRQNLTQIAAVSTQINDLVRSIAQAAQMQSKASESVTQTMTGVATIADQNSAEAMQVSDSFKQLLDVAQALQTEVGQFKVR
jgi:methyl-accepting chemotaxis protein PixJ